MDSGQLKLQVLSQLVSLPGYRVLLDYFEQGCRDLEADLLNTPVEQPEAVVARHRVSVGAWRLFHEVTARINTDVAKILAPPPVEISEKDKEEAYLKSLSN